MEGDKKMKKKVMVAIDVSESSHYALEWALQNLIDSNTQLIILTIQPLNEYSYLHASSFGSTPVELIQTFQENQRKVAMSLLEKAKEICIKHGLVEDVETITEVGDPKEVICEAVEKHNIQMLIVGSHGRGPLKRVILGSVSNYCMHNANCSVLVVKKPL
ncbi:universal stress protein A-like protein [Impatiens glandulifera]|uniref:universal stress protein A-like protein n=1 Tax=Impatiens glandulifera TaxID=253017 RepID=UPI001FB17B77|nr:universal stress protein A-like protein [Impatiens glandulifera]